MLGGSVGVETERGVGTMLFFDMPAFVSEDAMLAAVYSGGATDTQKRLIGLGAQKEAEPQPKVKAEPQPQPQPQPQKKAEPQAQPQKKAEPQAQAPRELTMAQLKRASSVAALATKRSLEPAPAPESREALAEAAEKNAALLQQYAAMMGERIVTKPVLASSSPGSRRSSTASSVSDTQKDLLATKILSHTNIR
jgi:outer membrane biosynthesis protein TonB